MSRELRSFLPLDAPASTVVQAFQGDPSSWLPDARRIGPDRWRLEVGPGMQRPVEVTIGAPWHVGRTWWRSWSWHPLPDASDPLPIERLLPDLDAELGVSVQDDRRLTLVLDGRYRPPGGVLGDALDAVALGRLARRTVERLLHDVATGLCTRDDAPVPQERR